jgi:hypothetical protein
MIQTVSVTCHPGVEQEVECPGDTDPNHVSDLARDLTLAELPVIGIHGS